MQIFVKTNDATITLDVEASDTIWDAKVKLHAKAKEWKPHTTRFIYAGKQLLDDDSLEDHGINEEATLHAMKMVHGD